MSNDIKLLKELRRQVKYLEEKLIDEVDEHLSIEERVNRSLLSQSIQNEVSSPAVTDEQVEVSVSVAELSALISNQVKAQEKVYVESPIDVRDLPDRPIHDIIEELRRSIHNAL